jgi:hypothetical protein
MKRFLVIAGLAAATTFASAGAGSAKQPVTACPPSFAPMTTEQFRDLAIALGFPSSSLQELQAELTALDKNGNDLVCVLDLPDTPGNKSYQFDVIDDTASVPLHP